MKKGGNLAEKYFLQKNWTVIEIVSCIFIVIGALLILLGFGYLGLPVLAVAGPVMIYSKSGKVSDSDVDGEVEKIISKTIGKVDVENTVRAYDYTASPITLGKDGNTRSVLFTLSVFDFKKHSTDIMTYTVDLLSGNVERKMFNISEQEKPYLLEERVKIKSVTKKAQFLMCEGRDLKIPVSTDDIYASNIIDKLCFAQNKSRP